MLDAPLVSDMERRFGDRFSGMSLTHVELLHWPVWRHTFLYNTFENVNLDPLEEGLLLLVQAGIRMIPELATLLGCSENYVRSMSARLADVEGFYSCLQRSGNDELRPTPHTASVLERCLREVPLLKQIDLLRDAVFGNWLSYGNSPFEVSLSPNPEDGPHRWLDSVVMSTTHDDEAAQIALDLVSGHEIVSAKLANTGDLRWVTLWLGCYQPESGARGRFLLFNPSCEDTPLPDLSLAFEHELAHKSFKLYFDDGPLGTSELFWRGLADRINSERKLDELESNRAYLAEATSYEEQVRKISGSVSNRVNSAEPTGTNHNSVETSSQEEPAKNEELSAAQQAVSAAREKIADLERQLASVPRIEHLDANQHPEVLRSAIRKSRSLLILICPWIRMKVLRPLLPEIDAAIKRGVHVLVGYGMPKSSYHPDKIDEAALEELRRRQSGKQLWLVHLGTHEKVIIQDDQLFVNSSFNFFSYTGGDGRRESGTIQRGGVGPFRDKFLAAFPEHIRQQVEEVIRPALRPDCPEAETISA